MFAANVAPLERLVRILIGVAVAAYGFFALSQAGILFVATGLCVAATGLVGFCPACALVGRRLKPRK